MANSGQADQDSVQSLRDTLDGLGQRLRDEYPRAAHGGRIEQVTAHAATLSSLLAQLQDEEHREAELVDRLIASYRQGNWRSPHPDHGFTHTGEAQTRLNDALMRGAA